MKWLKKLKCWLSGHEEFWCSACNAKILEIFKTGNPQGWECQDPQCREICARCGERLVE